MLMMYYFFLLSESSGKSCKFDLDDKCRFQFHYLKEGSTVIYANKKKGKKKEKVYDYRITENKKFTSVYLVKTRKQKVYE